jgi:TIR domain
MALCFISYARQRPLDELALAHVTDLLRRADISFWCDKLLTHEEGSGLNSEIAGELDAARVILVLASSQSLSSSYCQAEIISALEADKPLLRIDLEPFDRPPNLLPLASARTILWGGATVPSFEAEFAAALAEKGLDASKALGNAGAAADILYHHAAALIRPNYSYLKQEGEDAWRECVRRSIARL